MCIVVLITKAHLQILQYLGHTTLMLLSAADYKINNQSQTINNTVGDIVINKPIGNSSDFAKELKAQLPNAFLNQMYSNLKK